MKKFISLVLLFLMIFTNSTVSFADASGAIASNNDMAWVKLGNSVSKHLVSEAVMGSSDAVTLVDRNEKTGWFLNSASTTSAYINVNLSDSFAKCNTDGTEYVIKVEYLAPSNALFNIEYDSIDKTNRETDIVYLTGGKTWRIEKIVLTDAYFGDRLDGYDFRVGVRSDKINRSSGNLIISQISVTKYAKKNPVQITSLKSNELGNIFGNGEEKEFNVVIKNYSSDAKSFTVDYKAINDYGDVVWQKSKDVIAEENAVINEKITVDAKRYCLYNLVATVKGDGFSHSKTVPFSYVNSDEQNRKNNSCGFNVHFTWNNYDPYEGVEVMQKSNVGFLRCNLPWINVDPVSKGKLSFELPKEYQHIVNALNGSGIKWQFLLAYGNTKYGLQAYNAMPKTEEQVDGFVKYAEFITNYLRENNVDIHSYEIWNEPSLKSFNVTEEPAEVYANLADKTAAAMRKLNPSAEISVLSQAEMHSERGVNWAKDVLGKVNLDNMDAISVHPYNHSSLPEKGVIDTIDTYKQMYVEETGREPKVHISELGYYSYSTRKYTSLTQAEYNVRSYVYLHAMKLGSSFAFYDLSRDGAINTYTEHNFGSVESSNPEVADVPYAAKEYFLAIANMNKVLRNAEISKHIINDGTRYAFMFNREDDNKNVIALWSADKPEYKTFKLNTDEVTVYDIFGNNKKISGKDGLFTFKMSNSMCYVEGDFTEVSVVDTKYAPSLSELELVNGDTAVITFEDIDSASQSIEIETTSGIEASYQNNKLVVKAGNFGERTDLLAIDVLQNENIVHSYDINVKSMKPMSTSIYASPKGGKKDIFSWNAQVLIENHSLNEPVSGTVTIKSPSVFADNMRPVRFNTIPAQSIGNVTFVLPRVNNLDMYDVTYVVETDEGYKEEFTEKIDFTMALYTDTPPVIDGEMADGEWNEKSSLMLNKEEQIYLRGGYNWAGIDDLSAQTTIMYDEDNLYMFVKATDDIHYATRSGSTTWNDDSIQFGIAFEKKAHDAMVGGTFTEINLSDTPNGPEVYRSVSENNESPKEVLENATLSIKRIGDITYYEASVPWNEITIKEIDWENIEKIGFSMLINDNDGNGRKGWIEYASGIGLSKNIDLFTFLCTVK